MSGFGTYTWVHFSGQPGSACFRPISVGKSHATWPCYIPIDLRLSSLCFFQFRRLWDREWGGEDWGRAGDTSEGEGPEWPPCAGCSEPARPGHAIPITPSLVIFSVSLSTWRQSPLYSEAEGAVRGSWKAVFTAQWSHRGCHTTPASSPGGWAQGSLSRCPPLLQGLFRASPG